MLHERIDVRVEGSQAEAHADTYIIDHTDELPGSLRPLIVICPGGAYRMTSDRESELVALNLCAMGYHTVVLRYSVAPSRYPTALMELGKLVACLKDRAEEWHISRDHIAVMGFSAGGHLACSYGEMWREPWLSEALGVTPEALRPTGMVLCYPVITSGVYAHDGSFRYLLGDRYEELKDSLSLENRVTDAVPPTFLWHTFEDGSVPVQNSLLLASALAEHRIPVEFHLFQPGGHGLSLANRLVRSGSGWVDLPDVARWMSLLHAWLERWCRDIV